MSDTTRAALAQALDALRGAGIVMMRSIAAGRFGERYSYIQARDGSMIEATGTINSVNEAVTAAEAALVAPEPSQDSRKPLPDYVIVSMYDQQPTSDAEMIEFAREIERAHGIKNGGAA